MSVYKEKGKYYCRGTVNNHRYNRLCDGAKTAKEAKVIEDAIRYELQLIDNGIKKEKERTYSFSFLMNKYIKTSEANNKSVVESKQYSKLLTIYFGDKTDIKSIKPSDIENFKIYMLNSGRSKATTNRYLAALKRAYNIMIKDDLIDYNPVCKVKMFIEDNIRSRYLTQEEWSRLKKYLSPTIYSMVIVALQTGLRLHNILYLNWEQIDMNLKIIKITKEYNKGKKIIILPITDTLYNLLLSLNPKKHGYLFVNPDTGKPYTTIKTSFKTALRKAGIEDFKFHDLRRTVGTWLLEKGVDIRTIQEILAHTNISTTERYLSPTSEFKIKAMNTLDDYIL